MAHKDYPRSLYRQRDDVGPDFEFDGVRCEMLTVESEEEEAAARKDGWRNSPAEAGKLAKAEPLDHDGDGRKGGSKAGASSTAAKGAARRKVRK